MRLFIGAHVFVAILLAAPTYGHAQTPTTIESALEMVRSGQLSSLPQQLLLYAGLSEEGRDAFADSLVAIALIDNDDTRPASLAVAALRRAGQGNGVQRFPGALPRLERIVREAHSENARAAAVSSLSGLGIHETEELRILGFAATSESLPVAMTALDVLRDWGAAGMQILCVAFRDGTARAPSVAQSLSVWAQTYGWTDCSTALVGVDL